MPFCKLIVLPDFAMIFICFENTSFFLNVVRNFNEHDFLAYIFSREIFVNLTHWGLPLK